MRHRVSKEPHGIARAVCPGKWMTEGTGMNGKANALLGIDLESYEIYFYLHRADEQGLLAALNFSFDFKEIYRYDSRNLITDIKPEDFKANEWYIKQ